MESAEKADLGPITEKQLVDAAFSAVKLKEMGYGAAQLKLCGFDAKELKEAQFTAIQLESAGFTPAEMRTGGYTTNEVSDAGFKHSDNLTNNLDLECYSETSATITIKYCDVPSFLHDGEFFRNMDRHNVQEIEVPSDCFQAKLTEVTTARELCQLLRVTLYWTLDTAPRRILEFLQWNDVEVWQPALQSVPGAEELFYSILQQTKAFGISTLFYLAAVKTANMRLMRLLHEKGVDWGPKFLCSIASKFGHLECLQYAHQAGRATKPTTQFQRGLTWDHKVYVSAAEGGHLSCMQYAHQQGLEWHRYVVDAAARHGHLDCLRFAHDNGCPWSFDVEAAAAEGGSLACLRYAHEQGMGMWRRDTCINAAKGGHLSCLQYAHENGCPWCEDTVMEAVKNGHTECLRYALEHGCKFQKAVVWTACSRGHVECLQLLHQHGAPWSVSDYAAACERPDTACLQYLHENGCPNRAEAASHAAGRGHIDQLRYALEHGFPHGEFREVGSLECLRYLTEVQLLDVEDVTFEEILIHGDMETLVYYIDHGLPYIDTTFSEGYTLSFHSDYFPKTDDLFARRVEFAMERGWVPPRSFLRYAYRKDRQHCEALFAAEGWLDEEGCLDKRATSNRRRAEGYIPEEEGSECSDFTVLGYESEDKSDDGDYYHHYDY